MNKIEKIKEICKEFKLTDKCCYLKSEFIYRNNDIGITIEIFDKYTYLRIYHNGFTSYQMRIPTSYCNIFKEKLEYFLKYIQEFETIPPKNIGVRI